MPRTIRLTIAYDGTGLVGWQRQGRGDSIQGLIEAVLTEIEGAPVTLHGAGRTDAGAHALGQVASARVETPLADDRLGRALNAHLPHAIRVGRVETVADAFHARFSAVGKTYEYRIWNGRVVPPCERLYLWQVMPRLDLARVREATAAMVGTHDFSAFQGSGAVTHSTIRTVTSAAWRPGPEEERLILTIDGTGFLRYMVRGLVGTLVDIGLGRRPVNHLAALLERPDRQAAGKTVPAHGLFLVSVHYRDAGKPPAIQ